MARLFRSVLVPYDFSVSAKHALRLALALAREDRGRVTVLHALPPLSLVVGVPPGPFPPAIVSSRLASEQQRRLERDVARARRGQRRPPVTCRVVVADPRRAILDAADGATAVVMGTLGLSGLSHLVIGSVAEQVVRHARVPVLTVRAR